jgi:hypothetical protein
MSSTDERLKRFFSLRLGPAAASLRARGERFFLLGAEPQDESWYEEVARDAPEFFTFEASDCAPALRALWARQDLPELVALVDELMELAHEIEPPDESAELSSSMYVLY